jgi:uncharacterized protein involved in exopolysaccharide biosynthesis
MLSSRGTGFKLNAQSLGSVTQGAKIRSTYISYAKNERVRLETRVAELSKQVEAKKDQVEGARGQYHYGRRLVSQEGISS